MLCSEEESAVRVNIIIVAMQKIIVYRKRKEITTSKRNDVNRKFKVNKKGKYDYVGVNRGHPCVLLQATGHTLSHRA